MKLCHTHYPSYIAKVFAFEAGLLSDMETDILVREKVRGERDRLIQFQQMSLACGFSDCLTVYYGIDLSEAQITALKVIYEVTPKLLAGTVLDEALGRIANERNSQNPNMNVMASAFHTVIDILTKKQRVA